VYRWTHTIVRQHLDTTHNVGISSIWLFPAVFSALIYTAQWCKRREWRVCDMQLCQSHHTQSIYELISTTISRGQKESYSRTQLQRWSNCDLTFLNVGQLLGLCRNICGVWMRHRVCKVVLLSCYEVQLELYQNHQICRHRANNLEQATTLCVLNVHRRTHSSSHHKPIHINVITLLQLEVLFVLPLTNCEQQTFSWWEFNSSSAG
jgi:hypothetical protein